MVTDVINSDWLIRTNALADQYELNKKDILLAQFSNDQLHYLIYWNWGYSIPTNTYETLQAIGELKRRGLEFNMELAESIELAASNSY